MKLIGTLDDFTFLRTRDGFLAKMKTSLTASRLATDPAFIRTRENGAEFARAGKASKLLRSAFRIQMLNARDHSAASRLTKAMMEVVHTDALNTRGLRNVAEGEKTLLLKFDFNAGAQMESTLYALYNTAINRVTGEASVNIPAFVPAKEVAAPIGTTHFRIVAAAAAVDFYKGTFERSVADSPVMPLNKEAVAPLNLVCPLTPDSPYPIFLVLGIEFYQEVNGSHDSLKDGSFNALTIVAVNEPA